MNRIKILVMLCIVLMCVVFVQGVALAANGDIAGYIYSTDIRAYINGVEVESYNIGGKTVVVIEDILMENARQYVYDDPSRTLKFFSLKPDCLVEGRNTYSLKPGKIVGKIYETDIKTSVYDVTVPSYNIGGKTAVAIEDLGCDKEFSHIGGKYIWNETERTISLEFLYRRVGFLSYNKDIVLSADDELTELNATFQQVFHCGGGKEHFVFPEGVKDNADVQGVLPIKADDNVLGYYFCRQLSDGSVTQFMYYYPDKIEEAQKNFKPYPYTSKEDTITHFLNYHCVGGPRERFDTEDYSFVYISVAGTSWTSYNLLQVWNDGRYIDYGDEISTRNRSPVNLSIDRENEKVTFKFVDRYNSEWFTNYEIDLKAGTIKQTDN